VDIVVDFGSRTQCFLVVHYDAVVEASLVASLDYGKVFGSLLQRPQIKSNNNNPPAKRLSSCKEVKEDSESTEMR